MPASTDKNRDTSKAAVLARLEKYETIPPDKKEKVTDLPRWVKTALVMREVDGLTWNEAAARFNKTGNTLSKYGRSPAAHIWIEHLTEFVEDPVAMAKAYLSANALSVTLDRLAFLQAAIEAGDYSTGDKIAKDLQDRMGITAKKAGSDGAISVNVSFGGANFEAPVIEASWEVEGEDDEDA